MKRSLRDEKSDAWIRDGHDASALSHITSYRLPQTTTTTAFLFYVCIYNLKARYDFQMKLIFRPKTACLDSILLDDPGICR